MSRGRRIAGPGGRNVHRGDGLPIILGVRSTGLSISPSPPVLHHLMMEGVRTPTAPASIRAVSEAAREVHPVAAGWIGAPRPDEGREGPSPAKPGDEGQKEEDGRPEETGLRRYPDDGGGDETGGEHRVGEAAVDVERPGQLRLPGRPGMFAIGIHKASNRGLRPDVELINPTLSA